MAVNKTFNELSAFYIALWGHLDAFFDDNRWLRVYPAENLSDRREYLRGRYRKLRVGFIEEPEPILSTQINKDFTDVEDLTKEYLEKNPKPGDDWFTRARSLCTYLEELGLRYAELSAKERGLIK